MANYNQSAGKVFRSMLSLLKPDRKDISAIYFYAILAGLVQLSLPLGIQSIINFVLAGTVSTSIVVLIVLVVGGTLLGGLLQVRQLQLIEKLKQKIFVRYSLEFADRIPQLNVEKLDKYHLPELINRFFEVPSFQKGIEKILLDLPTAAIQMALGLLLLSFYHPVFIAFGAILILALVLIIRFTVQPGFSAALEASDYKYRVAAWLQELARMIKSFKYTRNCDIQIQKTDELATGYLEARTSYFKILLTQAWSLIGFKTLITAGMLIVGATLLVDQEINIGQFIAADLVIITIIGSVEKLLVSLDAFYEMFTSVEKMNAIIGAEKETEGTAVLSDGPEGMKVEFHNVNFAYPDGHTILQNIEFTIEPGQIALLTGASGSGKSSLFRLLTGAFKSFDGQVLIDELPISNFRLSSLRQQTGVLLNQQDIFRGTLLENITMGDPTITISEIMDVAEYTGLINFIQSQSQGFDTLLDPLGKRLSQSIRQRILLTRSLIGKSRLLLLEEPFLQLSIDEKKLLLNYIKTQRKSTAIIIAKEQDISLFDVVLRLEDGRLAK
ncbi:MAG: ABC transporter ATP-binding protein [Bacteroidetes bacterium]|nr:ABC transporter ATP-binding protein [Bacteroidota bacterium]